MVRVPPTFTFAAGNTRVLRRLPLYLLGALAARIVPRTPRLWVFGSGVGVGEGALPLYRLARRQLGAEVRLVWLASSPTELAHARELGLDAVAKSSAPGLWLTLRAQVLVVTHGMGDVNRFGVRGGFLVQLWHGIPLKRLHLDSPAALRSSIPVAGHLVRAVLARGLRIAGRQISLFPVASVRVVDRIASGFAVATDRIVVTGDPRDDVLLAGTATGRRAEARTRLAAALGGLPASARVVLYAPTWRDGAADPGAPDESGWATIADWLQRTDSVLIVRSHPLGHGEYAAGPARTDRVRLLDSTALADVTPVLSAVDALVTDYSSIAFDYALVGGPIAFLAPDVDSYTTSRGLYEPYSTFSGGRQVASWPQVLAVLDDVMTDPSAALAHTRWLRAEYFDHLDDGATARVLGEILARTGATPLRRPNPAASPGTGANALIPRPSLTALRFDGDRLRLTLDPRGDPFQTVQLAGPRGSVAAQLQTDAAGLHAQFELVVTRWGEPGLALPTGDYRLALGDDTDACSTRVAVDTPDRPVLRHELFRATSLAAGGGLVIRIAPPLADGERRPIPHRDARQAYLRGRVRPENAVYFESFYGRSASDNPAGIDRELARTHPEVRRYWSVADGSVAVPTGAIRLIEGSAEWWRVRAEARVYVINDWLRWSFHRRRHQRVLQTWHGTMLKRLALDRAGVTARSRFAVLRQQRRWDALLAQNAYSARIFRSAYAVRGPIWETGYPRNDVFADPARAGLVRARLGLPEGTHAVLYAPTWRDDRSALVDHLDLAAFAADLPVDHVLLVRGHSRTLAFGADVRADRVLDVTSYPDIADLMVVADVLITDYSSVMFDFAATGKPMIFFTPDLDHYGDVLRGFYFDLLAEAPGPVVSTRPELLDAVLAWPELTSKYAAQRAAWDEKFVPLDDGHAAQRVVQRMFDEGWLG